MNNDQSHLTEARQQSSACHPSHEQNAVAGAAPIEQKAAEPFAYFQRDYKNGGWKHVSKGCAGRDGVIAAYLAAPAPQGAPSDEWRECYNKAIIALAAIVNVHTPDKLFDLDAVPRDPVMAQVMAIRATLDDYSRALATQGKAAPTDFERCTHPDCGRFKDGAGWSCRALRDNACAKDEGKAAPAEPVELSNAEIEQLWLTTDTTNVRKGTFSSVAKAVSRALSRRPVQDADLNTFVHADKPLADPPRPTSQCKDSGWISVTERLPEDDSDVLVYVPENKYLKVHTDCWQLQHEDPIGMGGPTVATGFMWDNFDFEEVSHWMPIPPAPDASNTDMGGKA